MARRTFYHCALWPLNNCLLFYHPNASSSSWTQPLDLGIMKRVFYHSGLAFKQLFCHFNSLDESSSSWTQTFGMMMRVSYHCALAFKYFFALLSLPMSASAAGLKLLTVGWRGEHSTTWDDEESVLPLWSGN
jgi:hypothetical protein